MFKQAKAFSDFVGFHVRFQFVMLSALLVLAPVIIKINQALRTGSAFSESAGPVDVIAVLGLLAYAPVLFFFICRVGWTFLRACTVARLQPVSRWAAYPGFLVLFSAFVLFEAVLNGAVVAAAFYRVLDIFGMDLREISEFGERIWDRGCLRRAPGCP